MAGAVWMGDKVWQRAAGYANLEQKTPYDPAANVRIASVTKSFVATAVLQLVDAGALKLDDVLEKFVPGIANGPTITMRNLLGMTSGIYDFTSNAAFNIKFDANPDMPWTFADTLAIIKANAPLFAPGTEHRLLRLELLDPRRDHPDGHRQAGPNRHRRLDRREAEPHAYPLARRQPRSPPRTRTAMSRKDSTPRSRTRRSTTRRTRRRSSTTSTRRSRPAPGRSSRPSTTSRSGAGRSPKAACWSPRRRRSGSRPGGSTGSRSTSATAWAASGSTTSPGTTVRSTGSARWSSVIRRTTSPSPSSATSRPTPRRPRRRSATSSSGSSTRPSGREPDASSGSPPPRLGAGRCTDGRIVSVRDVRPEPGRADHATASRRDPQRCRRAGGAPHRGADLPAVLDQPVTGPGVAAAARAAGTGRAPAPPRRPRGGLVRRGRPAAVRAADRPGALRDQHRPSADPDERHRPARRGPSAPRPDGRGREGRRPARRGRRAPRLPRGDRRARRATASWTSCTSRSCSSSSARWP